LTVGGLSDGGTILMLKLLLGYWNIHIGIVHHLHLLLL
jgi:hypothetical protein